MTSLIIAAILLMASLGLAVFAVLFGAAHAWPEALACVAPVVPLAVAASWLAAEGVC